MANRRGSVRAAPARIVFSGPPPVPLTLRSSSTRTGRFIRLPSRPAGGGDGWREGSVPVPFPSRRHRRPRKSERRAQVAGVAGGRASGLSSGLPARKGPERLQGKFLLRLVPPRGRLLQRGRRVRYPRVG